MAFYFAYGSHLSPTQVALRCPASNPIGFGKRHGWYRIMNERGYAEVVDESQERAESARKGGKHGSYVLGAERATRDEHVLRTNRGVEEAMRARDLPAGYADEVIRPFVPSLALESPEWACLQGEHRVDEVYQIFLCLALKPCLDLSFSG
ncbi:hypothetical protein VTK73DRAFT_3673 [Phialemonium thermophilum]|uniref:Gamma-glutamylcyclotransferase n=1 Tax=Phialemonium thermophilum TaxID=223376 RepID=A0ABR3WXM2_9PEZI